ncbi:690_t:CDS:1 [Paraglomus occultum]|uniref:690_t:CDS:1 n=1 Tax=Paraglomus occultum TaxID=144539 RepID=A0A9N8Z8X2_9GLOM|nr:690_t:CDS:1 [Paraglomus occultum]
MSRVNRATLSLSRINRFMKDKDGGQTCVFVGTVVDDDRLLDFNLKNTVCALRFTKTAKARILKAGGEVITFDELAKRAPTGSKTVLLRGKRSGRKALKHFGNGPKSHSKYVLVCFREEGTGRKSGCLDYGLLMFESRELYNEWFPRVSQT